MKTTEWAEMFLHALATTTNHRKIKTLKRMYINSCIIFQTKQIFRRVLKQVLNFTWRTRHIIYYTILLMVLLQTETLNGKLTLRKFKQIFIWKKFTYIVGIIILWLLFQQISSANKVNANWNMYNTKRLQQCTPSS